MPVSLPGPEIPALPFYFYNNSIWESGDEIQPGARACVHRKFGVSTYRQLLHEPYVLGNKLYLIRLELNPELHKRSALWFSNLTKKKLVNTGYWFKNSYLYKPRFLRKNIVANGESGDPRWSGQVGAR